MSHHECDHGVWPRQAGADGALSQDDALPAGGDDLLGHLHLEAGAAQRCVASAWVMPAVPGTAGYGAASDEPDRGPSRIEAPATLS